MPKLLTPVNPPTLPKPAGFSHGFEVEGGKTLYLSGQVALDKDGTWSARATSPPSSARSARTSRTSCSRAAAR